MESSPDYTKIINFCHLEPRGKTNRINFSGGSFGFRKSSKILIPKIFQYDIENQQIN